jgi:hypothetical protein
VSASVTLVEHLGDRFLRVCLSTSFSDSLGPTPWWRICSAQFAPRGTGAQSLRYGGTRTCRIRAVTSYLNWEEFFQIKEFAHRDDRQSWSFCRATIRWRGATAGATRQGQGLSKTPATVTYAVVRPYGKVTLFVRITSL